MGSLLGMNRQEQEKEENNKNEDKAVLPQAEKQLIPAEVKEEKPYMKNEPVPYEAEPESEYIPIDNIRIRRRDEKEMKVPVSFSLSRKTAEQLKQIAYVERLSSSEIVSGLIEAYIYAHQDVLTEYRELLNRRK